LAPRRQPPPPHPQPAATDEGGHAVARFEPRSPTQAEAQRAYHDADLLVLLGPAGAGKTHCAVGLAVTDVLSGAGPRKRVVVLRPAVQADAQLGYLEGSLEDKLAPYAAPVRHVLARTCFRPPPQLLTFEALGYARGHTYADCVVVLDEAQNCTLPQLRLVISRLGRGARLVVCGDPEQSDLPRPPGRHPSAPPPPCPLEQAARALDGVTGVRVVRFPDGECHRHPLVAACLSRLRGL
jgi:phosphate starvation-inducible PhoH-like protein